MIFYLWTQPLKWEPCSFLWKLLSGVLKLKKLDLSAMKTPKSSDLNQLHPEDAEDLPSCSQLNCVFTWETGICWELKSVYLSVTVLCVFCSERSSKAAFTLYISSQLVSVNVLLLYIHSGVIHFVSHFGPERDSQISLCRVKQPDILTLTSVSHLQVLVSADTRIPKHRVACFDRAAALPVTAVDADYCDWMQFWMWAEEAEICWTCMVFILIPLSYFGGGAWAVGVLELIGRSIDGACAAVTAPVISTEDKYNLPFIWEPQEEDESFVKMSKWKEIQLKERTRRDLVILPHCRNANECSHATVWTVKAKTFHITHFALIKLIHRVLFFVCHRQKCPWPAGMQWKVVSRYL